MYVFDPYFHFHKPYSWVSYDLGNYVYQNDGISKNWEYDAIITGTSMTKDFSTDAINDAFGVDSVRLTFLGEGFRRINDNLEAAFDSNNDIKLVIRGVDPIWFVSDKDFLEYGDYSNYPTYLYDDDWKNDFQYIYNFGIIKNDLFPEIIRTIKGIPAARFDDGIIKIDGDAEEVLAQYERAPRENKEIDPNETMEMMDALKGNIQANVISTIADHPETRFIVFFPPYSIGYWEGLMRYGEGVINRRLEMERYVIEQLLKYDNVEVFSFLDCFEITTDLNNYVVDLHYTYKVSDYMLECMSESKEHMITSENYDEYLRSTYDFYLKYDYDSLFGDS